MRLPDSGDKYTNQWKYVEVARYVEGLGRVIRDKVGNDPVFYDTAKICDYADKNSNRGIYTSVFQYNEPSLSESVRRGSLYFDLDSDNLDHSHEEVKKLYSFFSDFMPENSIRVYFTGFKGFHVELEALTLGVTPSNSLHEIFRYIANDIKGQLSLETVDFAVYDPRRMWRLPGSMHQKTGLFKNDLSFDKDLIFSDIKTIQSFCRTRRIFEFEEQKFDLKSNEWYRSYIYKREEEKQESKYTQQYLLDRFRKQGTSVLKTVEEDKIFDPQRLFKNCPSIMRIWEKAEKEKHLEHEERLFLCSILTYSDDALFYLHEILKNCGDYNFEKSQAHIDDWIKRRELGIGGRPYTCDRANSVGVGCGNCDLDKRKKWIKVGDSYVETDEESSPSPIRFAYTRLKD
jgi:DNA primase catalytic subunit